MQKVRRFFVMLNIVLAICTLLAYSSSFVHPNRSAILAVLGLLFPLLFLLNVVFALSWLALKKYYALISIAVLALGWKSITGLINIAPSPPEVHASNTIRIGTFNAHQLADIAASRKPSRQQMAKLGDALTNPDILCMQEGGEAYKFKETLGYQYSRRIPSSNSILFSNLKIIDSKPLNLKPHRSLSGWFDIDTGSDTIRLFLLHLTSNSMTADSERLMEEGDIRDTKTWSEIKSLIGRYARAANARADQSLLIRQYISESPYPVVVCGDFNDVPTSFTNANISEGLNDSFDHAGRGFGTTYAGKIPGLRIDYILTDPKIDIISHKVLKLGMSDHNPVIVRIQITDL